MRRLYICLSVVALLFQAASARMVVAGGVNKKDEPAIWRGTDGKLMMALRSNAPHFWQWAHGPGQTFFAPDLLHFTGIVAGDPHHENFSHVFAGPGQKRVYVLNDMDDSGVAPYFMDFLKFLGVSISATQHESTLNTASMFKSYLAGVQDQLNGKSWSDPIPALLQEDEAVTREELENDYLGKIIKKTSDGAFDKEDDLTRWKDLSDTEKANFKDLEERFFLAALPKGYDIEDRAIFAKDGGGSGGDKRYWYYLKKSHDERHVIEFKTIEPPAVQYYEATQAGGVERLKRVTNVFWDEGIPLPFGYVGDNREVYWMRPKYKIYTQFDLKLFVKNPTEFADLSLYIAYRLGGWHAKQSNGAAYAAYLKSHQEDIIKAADAANRAYLKLAMQKMLQSKSNRFEN